jgi:hypothetical protein
LRRQQREAGLIPPAASSPSNSKSRFQSTEEESAARTQAVSALILLMRQMLPMLLGRLGKIPDPRNPKKLKHQLTVLMVYGILVFVFPTRRAMANSASIAGASKAPFWSRSTRATPTSTPSPSSGMP